MEEDILTKEVLIAQLERLPPGTEIYVRAGMMYDDAYPAKLRTFVDNGVITAYMQYATSAGHRNFPPAKKEVQL